MINIKGNYLGDINSLLSFPSLFGQSFQRADVPLDHEDLQKIVRFLLLTFRYVDPRLAVCVSCFLSMSVSLGSVVKCIPQVCWEEQPFCRWPCVQTGEGQQQMVQRHPSGRAQIVEWTRCRSPFSAGAADHAQHQPGLFNRITHGLFFFWWLQATSSFWESGSVFALRDSSWWTCSGSSAWRWAPTPADLWTLHTCLYDWKS